jgi:hypothetical protein
VSESAGIDTILCGDPYDCSKFTAKHLRAAEVRAAEGKMSVTLGLFGPSLAPLWPLFGPSVRSLLTRLHTSLLIILTYICHLHLSHFGLFLVSFWYLGRSKVCGDCSKFTAKHLRAAEGKMSVTLGLFGPSLAPLWPLC